MKPPYDLAKILILPCQKPGGHDNNREFLRRSQICRSQACRCPHSLDFQDPNPIASTPSAHPTFACSFQSVHPTHSAFPSPFVCPIPFTHCQALFFSWILVYATCRALSFLSVLRCPSCRAPLHHQPCPVRTQLQPLTPHHRLRRWESVWEPPWESFCCRFGGGGNTLKHMLGIAWESQHNPLCCCSCSITLGYTSGLA